MESGKSNRIILRAIAITGALTAAIAFLGNVLLPAQAQTSVPETSTSSESTDLPEFCSFHNAAQQSVQLSGGEQSAPPEQETVIVLGKLPQAPYVVVVPGRAEDALNTVRQCVPDAFQTRIPGGSYIHAGAFSRRAEAEELSRYLRSLQLDARVMYLP